MRATIASTVLILAVGFVLYLNATNFDATERKAIFEIAVVVIAREVLGLRRE